MSNQIMTASGQMYSKKVSLLSQQGVNATQSVKPKIKLKKKNGKKNLEGKHIRKSPKKRRGRHTKKVNKNKTYKEYVGQGRV